MEANDNKPKTASDYYRKAREQFDKGDMDGVLANLNEALRIKPDFVTALNNRGIVWKNRRYVLVANIRWLGDNVLRGG